MFWSWAQTLNHLGKAEESGVTRHVNLESLSCTRRLNALMEKIETFSPGTRNCMKTILLQIESWECCLDSFGWGKNYFELELNVSRCCHLVSVNVGVETTAKGGT